VTTRREAGSMGPGVAASGPLVSIGVASRLVSAVDFAPVADSGHEHEDLRVPDLRDDAIGPDAVFPKSAELAPQGFPDAARVVQFSHALKEENKDAPGFLSVYPVQVLFGLVVELNLPGHNAS